LETAKLQTATAGGEKGAEVGATTGELELEMGKNKGCYRGTRGHGRGGAALRARDGERLRFSVASDLDGG